MVDTNVVVAGLLTSNETSPTARILDQMVRGQVLFVVSTALVAEYRAVLLRPRIRRRHGLEAAEVDELLTAIVTHAIVRDVTARAAPAPDAGDQHIHDLIASVPDAVLVTGDEEVRRTAPGSASIVTPRGWIERES